MYYIIAALTAASLLLLYTHCTVFYNSLMSHWLLRQPGLGLLQNILGGNSH